MIVVSFRTPRPAITSEQVSKAVNDNPSDWPANAIVSSVDMPLRRAAQTPSAPSPAVASRLTSVPTNAEVVRMEIPCAR